MQELKKAWQQSINKNKTQPIIKECSDISYVDSKEYNMKLHDKYIKEIKEQISLYEEKKEIFNTKQLKKCLEYIKKIIKEAQDYGIHIDDELQNIVWKLQIELETKIAQEKNMLKNIKSEKNTSLSIKNIIKDML